ncbi:glycosyl transferase [Pseudooceanicola sp. CBS1P-1]|uniref:Glycosyl transferase n=1 Tax=Pseudooceanicola albus TaxID=2692189 RepID=A0A6L7GDT5_9RHOB|nr:MULTISPECIES: glycosyl transferase [Pseudooceanicola]MBT9386675.1 glycosyl transferase [Pseudooceanicola endophyticus]MXN20913.1 glycosyl transferase [Pseudooceanicola albus]
MSDRPLARKLIRPAFRLLRGGRGAHHEETWPHLSLRRPEADGVITWKGEEIARLSPLGGFLAGLGAEAAIIGSGPSLKRQRVAALEMPAVLLNGAVALAPRLPRPAALAIEDERFVYRHGAMLKDLPEGLPLLMAPAVIRVMAQYNRGLLEGRPLYLIDDLRKPFDGPKCALGDIPGVVVEDGAAFSDIPAQGIVKCGTVAYSALQILMAAPLKRILLAGIDLTNAAGPRFYEKDGAAAWSGLEKGQARILGHFALARQLAGTRGQALLSASPVSALLDLGYGRDDRLAPEPPA